MPVWRKGRRFRVFCRARSASAEWGLRWLVFLADRTLRAIDSLAQDAERHMDCFVDNNAPDRPTDVCRYVARPSCSIAKATSGRSFHVQWASSPLRSPAVARAEVNTGVPSDRVCRLTGNISFSILPTVPY